MIEKAAEVASGAIDALKSSPVLLALVLFQFMLLGVVGWTAHDTRNQDKERFFLVMKQCGPATGG